MRWLVVISLIVLISYPSSSSGEVTEDAITAAFLTNVLGFVEWTGKSPATYTICMSSDDLTKSALHNQIDTSGLNKKIFVKSIDTSRDTSGCSAVYIDKSTNSKGISYLIENARERQVLTIGNGDDFIKQGGLVQIIFKNRKLNLNLNIKASSGYRIKISSQLFSLAKKVY